MVASPHVVRGNSSTDSFSAEDIQDWMVRYLASLLEVDPDDVDPATSFDRYGLDSSAAIGMTGDLQDWLGKEVEPTLLYDYPTVDSLAQYLSES